MRHNRIYIILILAFIVFGNGLNVNAKTLCKRATTLHTETCQANYQSYFCSGTGYETNSTITYGSLGTGNRLTIGDAFDCDVNGDGTYDSTRERFYYITDTDTNQAVFIYYSNVYEGKPYIDKTFLYNTNTSSFLGPQTALEQLPTTDIWSNINRLPTTRNIVDERGTLVLEGFNYSGYAARLLTYSELVQILNNSQINEMGILDQYNFLMEVTAYAKENSNLGSGTANYGYWLETASSNNSSSALAINVMGRTISPLNISSSGVGVRPVIEVEKDEIQYTNDTNKNEQPIQKRVQTVEVEDTDATSSLLMKILGLTILILGFGTIVTTVVKKTKQK